MDVKGVSVGYVWTWAGEDVVMEMGEVKVAVEGRGGGEGMDGGVRDRVRATRSKSVGFGLEGGLRVLHGTVRAERGGFGKTGGGG